MVLRVLIVDDNIDVADSMAMLIGIMGHRPAVAYDAETGLTLAIEISPHIIFHDIALPEMSGYDAALRLRLDPRFDQTVLVAHTAYKTHADRARAKQAGFDHYVGKPLDVDTLECLLALPTEPRARVK